VESDRDSDDPIVLVPVPKSQVQVVYRLLAKLSTEQLGSAASEDSGLPGEVEGWLRQQGQ
jgi:hypothetical protein